MSSASRGSAPREVLECLLVKMGRTGPLAEPRRGPQAGKSGDPRSQNANTHHPLLLPPLARPSLYSPTPPVILGRRQPHTAAEPVNPRTPLRVGIHCRVFPGSASSPS